MDQDDYSVLSNWSQVERRMAFYAGITRGRQLCVPQQKAAEWRKALPRAIEIEHQRIEQGHLPRVLSLRVVLEEGDGRSREPAMSTP